MVVFSSQATPCLLRGGPRLWSLRPSVWLGAFSAVDLAAAVLATTGWVMAPITVWLVACRLLTSPVFAVVPDAARPPIFRWPQVT